MDIKDFYKLKKTVISFEIFPPKKDDGLQTLYDAVGGLSLLSPDFISVTYGAAGSGEKNKTAEIAEFIKKNYKIESLAHLTCANLSEKDFEHCAEDFKRKNIRNIMALRGDAVDTDSNKPFRYAKDLIYRLKPLGFCIGAAAYPEGHISCDSLDADIDYLKMKQDAGADFLITQLFFDNALYYKFMEKAAASNIKIPVSAGIMPILSKSQISRMIFMCGASLPSAIIKMLNKYGDEGESLIAAGLEYSAKQITDLVSSGADGIHIYTMNKEYIAKYCRRYASER